MAEHSDIEWTDATWPIVQGCDPVSQGCVGCYAVPLLWRMAHNPDPKISAPLQGVTEKHINASGETILRFTGKVALRHDRLQWPLQWKRPRRIFVPSHGDLFHKDVPREFIDKVFDVMERAHWHTYQVLTKRSARQMAYVNARYSGTRQPPAHIWFGVSVEDPDNLVRVDDLLATKAAVRFLSCEPLLAHLDLTKHLHESDCDIQEHGAAGTCTCSDPREDHLHWVIAGGESGPRARLMHPDWARSLRDQCEAAGVAFFFKQWGEYRRMPGGTATALETGDVGRFDRVGKKAAGRLLDGKEHNGMPKVSA